MLALLAVMECVFGTVFWCGFLQPWVGWHGNFANWGSRLLSYKHTGIVSCRWISHFLVTFDGGDTHLVLGRVIILLYTILFYSIPMEA
jgi:hypothetical protein